MQAIPVSHAVIKVLPRQLANQIAAGEVVERPASVVKELLENSLDAGATQIDIEVSLGGTQLIRVTDNGTGIAREELQLALSRHATSKIDSVEDLQHIATMGFRGEALASIASVSHLRLTSRPPQQESAWCIVVENDQHSLQPASHPQGTSVEVSELFYNVPARKKFLRSERTEFRHLEDVVRRMALAHFAVGFNFKHNQRQVFALPSANTPQQQLQRVARLFGAEFLQQAVQVTFSNGDLILEGWLAAPEYSRSQSDLQYFFVNGRMVRDKVISHAVRQAYEQRLHPGRFPVFVLNLKIPADWVDVNVHPTKHEVRFHQARLVHDFLYRSLQQAMRQENFAPAIGDGTVALPTSQVMETGSRYTTNEAVSLSMVEQLPSQAQLLATIEQRYAVLGFQHQVWVVDLLIAQQLILQQQLAQAVAGQAALVSQPVLIPFAVNLERKTLVNMKTVEPMLMTLGFSLSLLGEQQLMVREVPALLRYTELPNTVQQLLQTWLSNPPATLTEMVPVLAEASIVNCHSTDSYAELLVKQVQALDLLVAVSKPLTAANLADWFAAD